VREVSVKQARDGLRALLEEVQAGEEIVLVRRGRPIARIVPVAATAGDENLLPGLAAFRATIRIQGGSLGEALAAIRADERY
jgi:prevent-host-death family protein